MSKLADEIKAAMLNIENMSLRGCIAEMIKDRAISNLTTAIAEAERLEQENEKLESGLVVVEIISGCEGDCVAISDNKGSGKRICGPTPWGGGTTKSSWTVSAKDIIIALRQALKESK